MLSQGQKLNERKRLLALPVLEQPRTVRLKFRKIGSLQYISHLDLQRTFNRVITRACIPAWYTKGFNPHVKLVFSTPLSVGAQSTYEFLDIRIDREMDCREIMDRLNGELTDELKIEDAYYPKDDFSKIAWASYELNIYSQCLIAADAEKIQKTLTTSPLPLVKKTKAGEREVDIISMIHSAEVSFEEASCVLRIRTVLKASSAEYLNPEMLITGLKQKNGILRGDPVNEWYTIMRTSVMKEDMTLFT